MGVGGPQLKLMKFLKLLYVVKANTMVLTQRSDLFKMKKYICYIQDTLHCPLWV